MPFTICIVWYIAEHFARGDELTDRCESLACELDETKRVKLTQEIENVKLKNNLAQLEQKVMLMDAQIQTFEYRMPSDSRLPWNTPCFTGF